MVRRERLETGSGALWHVHPGCLCITCMMTILSVLRGTHCEVCSCVEEVLWEKGEPRGQGAYSVGAAENHQPPMSTDDHLGGMA